MTLREALVTWRAALEAAGCPEPAAEARLIAAHVTSLAPGEVPARLGEALGDDAAAAAKRLVDGRRRRVPLPYLLGDAWFLGLRFLCDRRALVPRPETELVAEAAVEWLRAQDAAENGGGIGTASARAPLVADLGTGSGCIGLAIAHACPTCRVVATDASADALDLARENAALLGVADRVTFLAGDLLRPLRQAGLVADLVTLVANLPYVSEDDYAAAPPELAQEPREALVAGPTGLEALARLACELPSLPALRFAVLEIGATQGQEVVDLLARSLSGWRVEVRRDYAGLDRVAVALRPAEDSAGAPGAVPVADVADSVDAPDPASAEGGATCG